MQIFRKPRAPYWHEILIEMPVWEPKAYAIEDEKAIRGAISGKIKELYPKAVFKTATKETEDKEPYLEVERLR